MSPHIQTSLAAVVATTTLPGSATTLPASATTTALPATTATVEVPSVVRGRTQQEAISLSFGPATADAVGYLVWLVLSATFFAVTVGFVQWLRAERVGADFGGLSYLRVAAVVLVLLGSFQSVVTIAYGRWLV